MKKIISFILSLCVLLSVTPVGVVMAEETNRESVEDLAHAIYQRLDNLENDSVLAQGYEAYKEGDYQNSLKLFRNHFVEKLRKWEKAYYPGYVLGSGSALTARLVAGIEPLNYDSTDGNVTVVRDYLLDYFTPISDPEVSLYGKINWLGGMDTPLGTGYWGFGQEAILSWTGGLPLAYYTDAKAGKEYTIYLDRFMQILGDFSVNQKKVTDDYMKTPAFKYDERDNRFWVYTWHDNNQRLAFVLGGLTQFAKLLPAAGTTTIPDLKGKWDNIVPPFGKANPEYYDKIDEYHLAQWVVHIFEDAVPFMKIGLTADFATNMKDSNKTFCNTLIALFSEFNLGDDFEKATREESSVWFSLFKDGTMLEASLNYNDDTYNGMKGLLRTFESMGFQKDWLNDYKHAITLYERFRENYKNSNLLTPKIGNGGDNLNIKEIWKNDDLLEEYKTSRNYTLDKNPPSYTSVHFPWGGYTTLRSGWKIEDDISLSAYSSEIYGSGHTSLIQNAVWLTAYGRPLIHSGEGSIYNESYLDEEDRPDYNKWVGYFGEAATKKGSTIIVDGLDQIKYMNTTDKVLKDASKKEAVQSKFLTSDYFDYIDGTYSLGYGTKNVLKIDDVTHTRQNIMIREADLFIITDTMKNTGSSSRNYSQIWRYPAEYTTNGYYGFTNDEVVVDEENNSIKTNETGTVNLFMSQFSNQTLSYDKYYGSKGDEQGGDGNYRGWSKSGIGADFMPSVDVHVNWADNNQDKNTQVVTLAMPSRNENTPYKSLVDISDIEKGITGFSLTTKDNIVVTNLSSATKTSLVIGDITADAKNLVVTENDGVIRGIVTDCDNISYQDEAVDKNSTSFEFVIENDEIKELGAIEQKTSFAWIDTSDGYYPTYNGYQINSIKNASVKFSDNIIDLDGLGLDKDKQYVITMFGVDPLHTPLTRDVNGNPILDDKKINNITADSLLYVNQGDRDATFWDVLMPKGNALDKGLYLIRIGGEDMSKPLEIVLEIKNDASFDDENSVVTFDYALWVPDNEKPLADKKIILGTTSGEISADSKLLITCGEEKKEYSNLAQMLGLSGDATLDASNVTFGVLLDSTSTLTGFNFSIK